MELQRGLKIIEFWLNKNNIGEDMQEQLRKIPSVNKVLENEKISLKKDEVDHIIITSTIEQELDKLRKKILNEELKEVPPEEKIIDQIIFSLEKKTKNSLRGVINASGSILYTNLGRAPMSKKAVEHITEIAGSYSNLEYEIDENKRGVRHTHLREIVKELVGGEDVLVVNNNAAAVLIVLNTFTKGKEVIISRGELVEIGGSYRIPEVISWSGGKIVEVGTTNRTKISDYENAITEDTSVLLKVHTSNYRIIGFTESASTSELAELSEKTGIPLINDLGSGLIFDLQEYGLPYEPTVREQIEAGCDIVTFSGDKLLGGAQAGIIVGKKKYIDKIKKNQLLRTLRVDKLTLAGLEVTLKQYLNKKQALKDIPVLKMISMTVEECEKTVIYLKNNLAEIEEKFEINIRDDNSVVGGGAFPEFPIPTKTLCLKSKSMNAEEISSKLRGYKIPIVTRIRDNECIIDVRTLKSDEYDLVVDAIKKL